MLHLYPSYSVCLPVQCTFLTVPGKLFLTYVKAPENQKAVETQFAKLVVVVLLMARSVVTPESPLLA